LFAGLHEGLLYVKMLSFDHTIILGVIWGNLDMMDPIFFRRYPAASYKCRTIVSDELLHTIPLAEDILKNEVTKGLLVFLLKWAPLSP